jgi:hypothetical protein
MVDLDQLEKMNDWMLYYASKVHADYQANKLAWNYDVKMDQIPVYHLANLEEVIGTLLLVTIDKEDPKTGYCFMLLGEDRYRIVIPDPKPIFKRWLDKPGLYFLEKVGILRLDKEGRQDFHLRYVNKISEESKGRSAMVESYYSMVTYEPPPSEPGPEIDPNIKTKFDDL